MDIGQRHKGVTAPGQGNGRYFSCARMTALHDQAADLGQQFGRQRAVIVHRCLYLVLVLVPGLRLTGEPARRPMPVHQLLQAIAIAARPSGLPADAAANVPVQGSEQKLAEILVGTEALKPRQQGRHVVPGSGIQPDVRGVNPAEHPPGIACLSHACFAKIGGKWPQIDSFFQFLAPTIHQSIQRN